MRCVEEWCCGTAVAGRLRCAACIRALKQVKDLEHRQRYDAAFIRARAEIIRYVSAHGFECWRCRQWMPPAAVSGKTVDVDHAPDGVLKPTHRACNRGKRTAHRNGEARMG